MYKTILVLSFVVASLASHMTFQKELTHLWTTWKISNQKTYQDAGEEAARFAIFADNFNKINAHNAATPVTANSVRFAINKFADLTASEFKQIYASGARVEDNAELVQAMTQDFSGVAYPDSVDWRNNGAVTPVKDQGQCGSCWTFSTTGALEGYVAITQGSLPELSEQQIVDCASSAGSGCSGGWPYLAIEYAAQAGLESESSYPYTAQDGSCAYNAGAAMRTNNGYAFVASRSVDALKTAIAAQPTSVVIEADEQVFQFYSTGVIQSGCDANIDHAVLAVGYGNVGGVDAFIVKNSWAASWGDGGYVYLSTDGSQNNGEGVCGILYQPVVPN